VEGTDIKEFFFDFSYLERTTGESIANAIKKSLATNGVNITRARGQSYDGASCMSSDKVGVQAQIKNLSPLAIYIHCHSHVLNFSIANACKVPAIRNMIDVVNAVYLFFQHSPKRQRFLERVLAVSAPDMKKTETDWVVQDTLGRTAHTLRNLLWAVHLDMWMPGSHPCPSWLSWDVYILARCVGCRIQDPGTMASFKSCFLPDHYCSSDSQKLPGKCPPHCHEIAEEGTWYIPGISNDWWHQGKHQCPQERHWRRIWSVVWG